jgi:predicted Fe-Mo cluster-binding NifX family protein
MVDQVWVLAGGEAEQAGHLGCDAETVSTGSYDWKCLAPIFLENYYNNKSDMKKRIAIPLESGILCSHFGHCEQFALIDTEDHNISCEELITPPPHEPGLLPAWLASKGVTDVIAGGMGQRAITLFNQQKINVFVGAEIKSHKELAEDLLNDSLNAGSNYCDH